MRTSIWAPEDLAVLLGCVRIRAKGALGRIFHPEETTLPGAVLTSLQGVGHAHTSSARSPDNELDPRGPPRLLRSEDLRGVRTSPRRLCR